VLHRILVVLHLYFTGTSLALYWYFTVLHSCFTVLQNFFEVDEVSLFPLGAVPILSEVLAVQKEPVLIVGP